MKISSHFKFEMWSWPVIFVPFSEKVICTRCIKLWLENGHNTCSQCRKPCHKIIKLYFSANESNLQEENALIKSETEKIDLEKKLFNIKSSELIFKRQFEEASQKIKDLEEKVNSLSSENSSASRKKSKTNISDTIQERYKSARQMLNDSGKINLSTN